MYKIHLSDGREIYLTQQPTNEQMYRYIRAKKAQGFKLSEIVFSWGPIHVVHNIETIVRSEELKAVDYVANKK